MVMLMHGTLRFKVEMSPINLDRIQSWIDQGRLDPSKPITMKELHKSRCLHGVKRHGVKLLARVRPTSLFPHCTSPSPFTFLTCLILHAWNIRPYFAFGLIRSSLFYSAGEDTRYTVHGCLARETTVPILRRAARRRNPQRRSNPEPKRQTKKSSEIYTMPLFVPVNTPSHHLTPKPAQPLGITQ